MRVEKRESKTKSDKRSMRETGRIPGTMYGKTVGLVSIAIDGKAFEQEMSRNGLNGAWPIELVGFPYQAVIKEVQRDPLTKRILHVDIHQVDASQQVKTAVAIHLVDEAEGVKQGGVMQQQLHQLHIGCQADRIPKAVEFSVAKLQLGDTLTAGELTLPEGVRLVDQVDEVVVTILAPQIDRGSEAAAPDAARAAEHREEVLSE